MKRQTSVKVLGGLSILLAMSGIVGFKTVGFNVTSNSTVSTASNAAQKFHFVHKLSYPVYKKHVTLNFWSWIPNEEGRIKLFNKYYPNIKINYVNAGANVTEYSKFSAALLAGSGIPDVIMLEQHMMSQYILSGGLKNITPYVSAYKKDFLPWTWNAASYNGEVYGVPQDVGTMGLFYQTGVFKQYHLSPPKTWSQFASDALKFHKKDPSRYYSWFSPTDGQWLEGLLWDAGAHPIQKTSTGWKIQFNTPTVNKMFTMWKKLIDKGAVQYIPDGTPPYFKNLNAGKYASIVGAVWYSQYLASYDNNYVAHKWNVATVPQWNIHTPIVGDWGGSIDSVTKASKHPKAAAIFAAFINTNTAELTHLMTPVKSGGAATYPADKQAISLPMFSAPNPVLNGQKANTEVFIKESTKIPSYQWSPWSSYVMDQLQTEINNAMTNKESISQALQNIQNNVVNYGQSQGYNVSS